MNMSINYKFEVSIIIPVHNRGFELVRALKSIELQSFSDYEVIIIDDFSEPSIKSTLKTEFKKLEIKIFRLLKKGNANIARNKGVIESKGKYIAFLDSDDEWKKNHLSFNLDYLIKNKLDGVFGGIDIIKKSAVNTIIPRKINENEKFANYIINGGLCSTPTFLISSHCFKKIKFDETLDRHQDWDFGIRFFKHFKFMPTDSSTVLVHWENDSNRKINLISSKIFIQKHANELSKRNFHLYHRNMFHKAKHLNSNIDIIKYYETNSLKNFEELTKTDFMSIYEPKSVLKKIYYHLIFLIKK